MICVRPGTGFAVEASSSANESVDPKQFAVHLL
jgi:hypothetical protein